MSYFAPFFEPMFAHLNRARAGTRLPLIGPSSNRTEYNVLSQTAHLSRARVGTGDKPNRREGAPGIASIARPARATRARMTTEQRRRRDLAPRARRSRTPRLTADEWHRQSFL